MSTSKRLLTKNLMQKENALRMEGDPCSGGKRSKERIMVASNMSGTEKLPLLVIGKAKKPRCFNSVKSLPVDYTSNSKAWMSSEVFNSWLKKIDNKFISAGRKIVMFIDNCPAHPKAAANNLTAIKLEFLPPNTTSIMQPMDQGIIKNLKVHYRKRVVLKILQCLEENSVPCITLLDSLRELRKAWSDVTQQTIVNCFKKAGFKDNLSIPKDT
ncbi:tigger transposable element-derived protein 4-like, partial [Uloborus diversus]|uniref:tigger transposable element-derived protein 4-like n=1 Tax=Uloborus diversus TaxID=327109 RepID=UPI002408F751